jgi:hypothetical protein
MEVHAPHHPLSTWREFWIHLGTISVGLLIALGMEQSAEWMHRVHERHALQRELHDEGERNEATLKMDFERMAALKDSLVAWHHGVDDAIAKGGRLDDPPNKSESTGTVALPSEAMWDSARASGRVALLSDDQTAVYAFLYQQEDRLKAQEKDWTTASVEKQELERRFERSFENAGKDGAPDFSRMNVEDLKSYSAVLNREIAEMDEMTALLHYFDAVNRAVLDGARSEQGVVRRVDEERMDEGAVPVN